MNGHDFVPQLISTAKAWLEESEFILFSAGAGMTAAAGINYADTALFKREYPAMLQYGFNAQYELIGFDNWTPDLQWGYWAAHVNFVRFKWPQTEVYQQFHQLAAHIDNENTFVMTSNVDAMFERNGFDANRIYTPQGDYALLQCTTPCTDDVWPWKAQIDKIIAATDPKTQRLLDNSLIPCCPNCGGTVFPNVRSDASFIDAHLLPNGRGLEKWLNRAKDKKGVIIEVGAGFNTPSVIRWPNEHIICSMPDWKLLRINFTHADVPDNLSKRAIGFKGNAANIIQNLQ
ncbi:phosphatase [Shewanella sediminis HAW-EB3]|uniref:Phosphatase n=1 Tax=Shewanella sediminis (strain HAW-EB3) TaxID=425104 RepID=A8FSV1_SHESH|nr:phosphatase [Shewanella sediminis]ABV35924.1 phosphatase [Shewanella sediminis HAW-EB3]